MFNYFDTVQKLSREGFEAATAVPAALTKEFQAAAEGQKDYSNKAIQEAQAYVRRISGVKSFDEAVSAQNDFLNMARRDFWDQAGKLNDYYFDFLRALLKPVERASSETKSASERSRKVEGGLTTRGNLQRGLGRAPPNATKGVAARAPAGR